MGDLVHLAAGGLEEDGRADAPMQLVQRTAGVRVEGEAARRFAGEVGPDGRVEPLLSELAEDDGAEIRLVEGRRPQGDERLLPRLVQLVQQCPGDPLRQHRQGAARLLEVRERLPLPPEDRERGRMEGIAGLETAGQDFPGAGVSGGGVGGQPLRREPGAPLEAPLRVRLRHPAANLPVAQVLEQAAAHHLADVRFVVRHQVARHASHQFGDAVLPRQVVLGHVDLASRQADDRDRPLRSGYRHGEVLQEGVEVVGSLAPVPVQVVQHLVEEQQDRAVRRVEDPGQRLRPRRNRPRRVAEGVQTGVPGQLPGEIHPRRFPARPRIPGPADEDRRPRPGPLAEVEIAAEIVEPRERRRIRIHQVVQSGQGVGLAPAELGHQAEHRRGVRRAAVEAAQHHAEVLLQGAGEHRPGEELRRIPIVLRRLPGDDLFQRDGELVRAERPAPPHFQSWRDDLVPRLQGHSESLPSRADGSFPRDSRQRTQRSKRRHEARILGRPIR